MLYQLQAAILSRKEHQYPCTNVECEPALLTPTGLRGMEWKILALPFSQTLTDLETWKTQRPSWRSCNTVASGWDPDEPQMKLVVQFWTIQFFWHFTVDVWSGGCRAPIYTHYLSTQFTPEVSVLFASFVIFNDRNTSKLPVLHRRLLSSSTV